MVSLLLSYSFITASIFLWWVHSQQYAQWNVRVNDLSIFHYIITSYSHLTANFFVGSSVLQDLEYPFEFYMILLRFKYAILYPHHRTHSTFVELTNSSAPMLLSCTFLMPFIALLTSSKKKYAILEIADCVTVLLLHHCAIQWFNLEKVDFVDILRSYSS